MGRLAAYGGLLTSLERRIEWSVPVISADSKLTAPGSRGSKDEFALVHNGAATSGSGQTWCCLTAAYWPSDTGFDAPLELVNVTVTDTTAVDCVLSENGAVSVNWVPYGFD